MFSFQNIFILGQFNRFGGQHQHHFTYRCNVNPLGLIYTLREQSFGFHAWKNARNFALYVGTDDNKSDLIASSANFRMQCIRHTSLFSSFKYLYQFLHTSEQFRKSRKSKYEKIASSILSGKCVTIATSFILYTVCLVGGCCFFFCLLFGVRSKRLPPRNIAGNFRFDAIR